MGFAINEGRMAALRLEMASRTLYAAINDGTVTSRPGDSVPSTALPPLEQALAHSAAAEEHLTNGAALVRDAVSTPLRQAIRGLRALDAPDSEAPSPLKKTALSRLAQDTHFLSEEFHKAADAAGGGRLGTVSPD